VLPVLEVDAEALPPPELIDAAVSDPEPVVWSPPNPPEPPVLIDWAEDWLPPWVWTEPNEVSPELLPPLVSEGDPKRPLVPPCVRRLERHVSKSLSNLCCRSRQ
jgi:hypothetical protein